MACPQTKLTAAAAVAAAAGLLCVAILQLGPPLSQGGGAPQRLGRRLQEAASPPLPGEQAKQLPEFLLPPLPPQASSLASAILIGLGNLNAFLTAVDSTYRIGGVPAIAIADAAAFGAGRAVELAAAIGASMGLAEQQTQLGSVLYAAYSRAVAHAIASSDIKTAGDAIAAAFTLAGGPDLALAVSAQLGEMVQAGCTSGIPAALAAAGNAAAAAQQGQLGDQGLPTFALAVAQQPDVAACWLAAGGSLASASLAGIAPILRTEPLAGASSSGADLTPVGQAMLLSAAAPVQQRQTMAAMPLGSVYPEGIPGKL
ncbi:hypothetical protein ABPG77_006637 [Micractinium sp. CCAP 211/92]